jgi:hypothetical protein
VGLLFVCICDKDELARRNGNDKDDVNKHLHTAKHTAARAR